MVSGQTDTHTTHTHIRQSKQVHIDPPTNQLRRLVVISTKICASKGYKAKKYERKPRLLVRISDTPLLKKEINLC